MICNKCKKDKPEIDFWKKQKRCKDCSKEDAIIWRTKNPERFKELLKKYRKSKKGSHKILEYKEKNREKSRDYYQKWYKKNGRKRNKNYIITAKKWIENHKEEVKAQRLLRYAVKIGKIIKPKKCEDCKKEKRLSGHHESYSKPLKVIWLCSSCHKLKHTLDKLYK